LKIGIDYTSHPDPDLRLEWCAEDAFTMANFLCDNLGFKHDDVRIITDKNPWDSPTKENILAAMRELVRDAKPHDSFFLYVSGHGTQVKDMSGDERSGLDQCICAVDWRGNGQPPYENTPGLIIDDVMHEILVKPLPLQCRLTAVFDACHSETLLDLPYVYSSMGVVKEIKHENKLGLLREKASYADVVSLSASKDSQNAEETQKGGALRLAFINCLTTFEYNVTYKELVKSVLDYMRNNRCKQKPVLSSSHEIDTDCWFIV
jgi:metacaspase-1